jgi:hypothetical protein
MTNLTKNSSSYTLRGVSQSNTACTHLLLLQLTHAVANPVPKELDLMQSTFFT